MIQKTSFLDRLSISPDLDHAITYYILWSYSVQVGERVFPWVWGVVGAVYLISYVAKRFLGND